MNIKEIISRSSSSIKASTERFMSAAVYSFLLYIIICVNIITDDWSDTSAELTLTSIIMAVFSVFLVVLFDKFNKKTKTANIIGIAFSIPAFIFILCLEFDVYFLTGCIGIMIALLCFVVAVMHTDSNRMHIVPHLFKSLTFVTMVCSILSIGISICIRAIESLLFSFNDSYKVYLIVNAFIWIIVFINLFLTYIPKHGEEITLPKLFRVIIAKVALPVYLILIAILYIYLIKIIVTWKMPVGRLNWFASFASLFFVFFTFCVRQYDGKLTKIFTRFAGFGIVPIVIMQIIGIYQRVAAYGLTTPRTVSIILVVVSIMFAIYSMLGKKLENVLWAVGIITLIFTLVPKFNVIDMPIKSQSDILKFYLDKNNILVDGKLDLKSDVSDKDRERISESYKYLYLADGDKPEWFDDIDSINPWDLHDWNVYPKNQIKPEEINNVVYTTDIYEDYIDISKYSGMTKFYAEWHGRWDDKKVYSIETHNVEGIEIELDLMAMFKKLYAVHGDYNEGIKLLEYNDEIDILFKNFELDYIKNTKEVLEYTIDAYVLFK